ncbi:MAG TPA: protein-disulfide reductase DsbD domain-containing protein, partial [Candidatus Angelobacter sp.]|nr:protein-disulfide reductase DsbD domain-containing protein [Candidatus Angelobacter sp.]
GVNRSRIAMMMAVFRSVAVSFLWSVVVASAFAQPSAPHARVALLARQTSIAPGSDLQLGIHFILEPGWHIYWINPGDSGQPPSFKWQLPTGFTAGEVQWPRPERMQTTAELADYGYHGEALLMVPIHAPQFINNEQLGGLRFAVEARWLVCREVCIPEHASLELFMHSGAINDNPAAATLFADAEKLLPVAMPQGWKAEAESRKDNFLLTVAAGKPITKAIFFPLDHGQIDNPAPQALQSTASGIQITLKKSDLLLKPISVLRGLLVIPGGPAYRIEAPVR